MDARKIIRTFKEAGQTFAYGKKDKTMRKKANIQIIHEPIESLEIDEIPQKKEAARPFELYILN
jgi:hypothetical protein